MYMVKSSHAWACDSAHLGAFTADSESEPSGLTSVEQT
jgi:hypothetical protein